MGVEKTGIRFGSNVKKRLYQDGKVGATAGWTVRAAADSWMSTVAASQSAGTLVIPLSGLHIGDVIVGYHLEGQIESAGNAVTMDAQLYVSAAVAAEPTNTAVVGTNMTQLSVTADSVMSSSTAKKEFDSAYYTTVEAGKSYYLLLTCTTNGSTDVQLMGAYVYYMPAV